jgi:hypothetical protein
MKYEDWLRTMSEQLKIEVEVVDVLKKWNVTKEQIPQLILENIVEGDIIKLYRHDTWGSCREWKAIVLHPDGSYLDDGEWLDNSSHKNAHKKKIMKLSEFLEKYAGKELLVYVNVSPSCNKSRQYSFKAIVKFNAER